MRHHLLSSTIAMAPSSISLYKQPHHHHHHHHHHKKPSNPNPSSTATAAHSSIPCKHSPSATLDILILVLVLFSGAFLITSYFSYIFQSLSLLLPPLSHSTALLRRDSAMLYFIGFVLFFVLTLVLVEICYGYRSKKCDNPRCKGLKKAMEFDLQLQTEECLRSAAAAVREIDELPWKGGSEGNPDYECLRMELRKMAPPNGRAVLLFRAKCGCPVAKLEGWGAKRGRRHKKGLVPHGGGDHR
ncbi:uncharacterized protein At5g19025 [Diospyros lotus]|uniref:uncharacterized protein At5g19025 n=1 Tax=Diospyros lotus TaxID=55363 RepID=UPI0022511984|nr:uncharacterized protein At5g19025 [Diospyros lotus]